MLEIVSDARAAGTPGAKPNMTSSSSSQGNSRENGIEYGLLANLVEANMVYDEGNVAGEKPRTLTDEELLSDTFVRSKNLSAKEV